MGDRGLHKSVEGRQSQRSQHFLDLARTGPDMAVGERGHAWLYLMCEGCHVELVEEMSDSCPESTVINFE